MKAKDITTFRNSIAHFTLEQLEAKRNELQNQLSKMIMDSNIVMQIAVVEAKIKEKGVK